MPSCSIDADQAGTLTASVLQGMHKEYGALSPIVDSAARLSDSQQEVTCGRQSQLQCLHGTPALQICAVGTA